MARQRRQYEQGGASRRRSTVSRRINEDDIIRLILKDPKIKALFPDPKIEQRISKAKSPAAEFKKYATAVDAKYGKPFAKWATYLGTYSKAVSNGRDNMQAHQMAAQDSGVSVRLGISAMKAVEGLGAAKRKATASEQPKTKATMKRLSEIEKEIARSQAASENVQSTEAANEAREAQREALARERDALTAGPPKEKPGFQSMQPGGNPLRRGRGPEGATRYYSDRPSRMDEYERRENVMPEKYYGEGTPVQMMSPDGSVVSIPRIKVEEAMARGYVPADQGQSPQAIAGGLPVRSAVIGQPAAPSMAAQAPPQAPMQQPAPQQPMTGAPPPGAAQPQVQAVRIVRRGKDSATGRTVLQMSDGTVIFEDTREPVS